MNVRALLLLVLLGQLAGCAVNPATGRNNFVMMSEQQELDLGRRYNQQILKENPRYADEKLQAYVQQVGERVAKNSHRNQLAYQFTVVDSPDINAFALPGGYIYHGLFDTHPDNDRRLQQMLGPARALATGQQEVNREGFLKRLEGLPFGDSAETGVRRGQRFYHADLNFTLAFPQGWSLLNRPDALIGHTADQQAFVAMTLEDNPQKLAPAELLRQRVGGQRLVAGVELQQAGLTGYSAVLPGNAAKRIAVIQHGARAYLFVAAVRGQASLESQDAQFLSVIKSFRPMTATEYKQAQRLQLVKVKPGQTLESLAKDSPLSGDAVKALRLLNNLYPSGQPRPGDWLKVVR